MAKERFLINPIRKQKAVSKGGTRKVAVNKKKKRNAQKKKRVITRTVKKVVYRKPPKKKRKNPIAAVGANPPTIRRRKRRNAPQPIMKTLQKQLPFFVSGGVGATAVTLIPGMFKVENPWMKRGLQLAVAIGGGSFAGTMLKNKQHGSAFTIGGGAVIVYDLLSEFILAPMGLADYNLDAYELDAYPGAEPELGDDEDEDEEDSGAGYMDYDDDYDEFSEEGDLGAYAVDY